MEYVICMFQSPTHCYYPLEDIISEHKINKLIHQASQHGYLAEVVDYNGNCSVHPLRMRCNLILV